MRVEFCGVKIRGGGPERQDHRGHPAKDSTVEKGNSISAMFWEETLLFQILIFFRIYLSRFFHNQPAGVKGSLVGLPNHKWLLGGSRWQNSNRSYVQFCCISSKKWDTLCTWTQTSERSKETSTVTVGSGKSQKKLSQSDISTPEIQLSSIN